MVAHWTSNPAFTHSIFSWPGVVASAGMAWNPATPAEFLQSELDGLLDRNVIGDFKAQNAWGRCIIDLGNAEHLESADASSGSVFQRLLVTPDSVELAEISGDKFTTAAQRIRRAQTQLLRSASASPSASDADVRLEAVRHELQLSSELLLVAARYELPFTLLVE